MLIQRKSAGPPPVVGLKKTLNYFGDTGKIRFWGWLDSSAINYAGSGLYTLDCKIDSFDISANKRVVEKQFRKPINQWQWEKLKSNIYYFDFWGMRERNGIPGVDGTSLKITGYKKSTYNNELRKITRWSAERTGSGTLLKTAFELSGVKGSCLNINLYRE